MSGDVKPKEEGGAGPTPLRPEWEKEIKEFGAAIGFAGFNPSIIRKAVVTKLNPNELLRVLTIAAQVGNNPGRLAGKVNDQATGKRAQELLAKHSISTKAGSRDGLTLPRIAIAVAPLFYKVRQSLGTILQNQDLGTGLEVAKQSPSLACYSDQPGWENYKPWLLAFGRQIKRPKESNEDSDKRTDSFRMIAVGNAKADPYMTPGNLSKTVPELLAALA